MLLYGIIFPKTYQALNHLKYHTLLSKSCPIVLTASPCSFSWLKHLWFRFWKNFAQVFSYQASSTSGTERVKEKAKLNSTMNILKIDSLADL